MKGRPHDPRIVEPGPTPPNGERHGIWRILLASSVLAVIALTTIGAIYL